MVGPVDLHDVGPLKPGVVPARGMTLLYDAVGRLIAAAEHEVATRAEWGLPAEDVVVVIFTDGLENASREWDQRRVFDRIRAKQAEGGPSSSPAPTRTPTPRPGVGVAATNIVELRRQPGGREGGMGLGRPQRGQLPDQVDPWGRTAGRLVPKAEGGREGDPGAAL